MQPLQPVAAPIGHLGPVDLAALPISTFEKGCGFVRGLLPFRLAHLEELFSDSMLWHVAELTSGEIKYRSVRRYQIPVMLLLPKSSATSLTSSFA